MYGNNKIFNLFRLISCLPNKILLSVFFSLLVAASTSSIAWLLDPAIEKIFIQKNQTLILIIPSFRQNIIHAKNTMSKIKTISAEELARDPGYPGMVSGHLAQDRWFRDLQWWDCTRFQT